MAKPVLLDVTSIVAAPVRSGIQRVEREVIRHWPESDNLVFVSLDPTGRLRQLPDAIRGILLPGADQAVSSFAQDQWALSRLCSGAPELPEALSGHILNLELFFERWRADAYLDLCRRGWRVQWLVYDFMPWLHPELFPQGTSVQAIEYLRALRDVPEVAFISSQTRAEYSHRVMRGHGREGPVLPLGADGLGLERQQWSAERRNVVVIGTVERRKNVHLVVEAFRSLWADGVDLRLVLVGRIAPPDQPAIDAFAAEAGPNRLEVLDHVTDAELRAVLRRARAVLFASTIEGFGLPPYEAIYAGIPAITAASLPSMKMLSSGAHVRLSEVTRESLVAALRAMNDDEVAARYWSDPATADLPTWSAFVAQLARWAGGG